MPVDLRAVAAAFELVAELVVESAVQPVSQADVAAVAVDLAASHVHRELADQPS